MKTPFEIQTEAGSLWPDIVALLDAKEADCRTRIKDADERIEAARNEVAATSARAAGLTSELDALKEKTSAAIAAASAAIADPALDAAATIKVVETVIADVTKDSKQRQREALAADIAAKQAELDALA
jgi:septal ring factor EnvC (AmiA/AmiB activator)